MTGEKRENSYTKSILIRMCKFTHIFLTVLINASCLYFYNVEYNQRGVYYRRFILFILLYTIVLFFGMRTYKAYNFGLTGNMNLILSQTLADIIAGGAFYVVFTIANSKIFTPVPLILMLIAQLLFNIVWSVLTNKFYFRLYPPKKTVLIYNKESVLDKISDAYERRQNFEVIKKVRVDGEGESIEWIDKLDGCEAAFVAGLPLDARNKLIKFCIAKGIECYVAPCIGDIVMMGSRHMDMFSVPVFDVSRASPNVEYAFTKRAIDIVCSLIGIILLAPLMIILAIAIRAYDKGPAFYRQVRLTRGGRKFEILKFRSMRVNAESDGVARLAGENDDRITPIGKIIRACRLDELPQLFNILKGDMTIVGPRPERPEIAEQYEEFLPEFNLRLQVKAGLTGLAQIYGRYNTEPYDKLQMDIMYINEMSLVKDISLMFATVKILFIKESTKGTEEGQTTAMANKEENKEREVVTK